MSTLGSSFKNFLADWRWTGWLITGFAAISLLPHCSSSIGDSFKTIFAPPERKLLGVVDNKLPSKSGMQQATKLQTKNGIVIEILGRADENGYRKLLDKVAIPDIEDGYYHLHGRAVNLAITDVDGDGEPEVLAPTYDSQGRPRLNAIKFDVATKRFLLDE